MKILTFVSELPPTRSGVALTAGRLVELHRALGHEVEAVEMRRLPSFTWGEVRLSFFCLRWPSLKKALRDCDCVHIHGPAPTFSDLLMLLVRLSTPSSGKPKIVYTHHFELDLPGARLLSRLYDRLHLRFLRLADSVVVTTEAYRRRLRERGIERVEVIPWGADHRVCPPARRSEDPLSVLTVVQLRPYKGIDVLLRAFESVPSAELHVVGEGHRRKRYEALAARRGLDRFRFHGQLPDAELNALFSASHVIVLPSVSKMEAFGLALLEGMRAGLVPVASDLPGVSEVVRDAGILVAPGDHEALAAALVRLRDDRELRARLSARAARRARSFRWKETSERYAALFERLVEGEPQARRAGARGAA